MKLLCLDFGDKTVGVAVGDTDLSVASGIETIFRKNAKRIRRTFARVDELIKIYKAEAIVVGLPIHMDGTYGERIEKTQQFAIELKRRTGLKIFFQDERLSSFEAMELMKEAGRKQGIDEFAAVIILRDYLNGNYPI